jgi:hypothetical protein
MKYSIVINQAGVVDFGLLGRVDRDALWVLDYIYGWFRCGKAKRVEVKGRTFVWVSYRRAVQELPLLFNHKAKVEALKNQFGRLVSNLREAELVESVRDGRNLYLRPSDLAKSVVSYRGATVRKSAHTATSPRDDTVMPLHDDTVMPLHDDSSSTHIDETMIKETYITEQTPHSPPSGERDRKQSLHGSDIAEEIYNAYPKNVGKPSAVRAIKRALKMHPGKWLLERTKLFAKTYKGDRQFIPYPATWFNNERFNDDPATWSHSAHRPSLNRPTPPPRQFDSADYQQDVENF